MSRNHNNHHHGNGGGGGPQAQRIAKMSLASYIVDRTPRRVDARDSSSNMIASSTSRPNNNHNNGNHSSTTPTTYRRETVRAKLAAYHRAHRVSTERLRELAAKNAKTVPSRLARHHNAVPMAASDQLRKSHDVRMHEMLLNYVMYHRPPNCLDDDQPVTNVWRYDEARRGLVYEFDGAFGWQRCSTGQMAELISYVERQCAANLRIREANEHQRVLAIQAANLQRQQQHLRRQQQPLFDALPLAQQILRGGSGPSPFGLPPIGLPDAAEVDNFLSMMQFHGPLRGGRFPGPPQPSNSSLVVSPPMHRPQPQRGRPSFISQHHTAMVPRHRDSSRVKYDSNSDGFFYDCGSAEMWFRRQPIGGPNNANGGGQRPPSETQLSSPPHHTQQQQPWSGAVNFAAETQASQFINDFSGLGLRDQHNNSAIGIGNNVNDDLLMSQSAPTLLHCVHGAPMALAFCCTPPPPQINGASSLLPNGTSRVVGHHRRGGSSDMSAYNSASTTTVNSSLSDSPPPLFAARRRPQQLQLTERNGQAQVQNQQSLNDIVAFAERLSNGALTPPNATSSTMLDFYVEQQQQRGTLRSETSAEDAFEYDPSASDTENMMVDFVLKPSADDDNLGVNPESSLADLMTTPTSSMPAISRNVLKPIQRPNIIDSASSEEKNTGSSQIAQPPAAAASMAQWWNPMAPSAFDRCARSIWAVTDEQPAVEESSRQPPPSENQAPTENFYSYFGPDPFYRNSFASQFI